METTRFSFGNRRRQASAANVKMHAAIEPRLNASREPRRITQKEKRVYSLRQKSSSKIRLPRLQARRRSSCFLMRKAAGIRSSTEHSSFDPGKSGQTYAAFQLRSPPRRDEVSTSAQLADRSLSKENRAGSSSAPGYTYTRAPVSSRPERINIDNEKRILSRRWILFSSYAHACRASVKRHG